ncbi:MAG: hypothetical protein NTY77_06810 [Elusimicrobia bacterium]|nr:hypothetical protein [Elusimicrobiota bacterium]
MATATSVSSRMQQVQHRVAECKRRLDGQNRSVADACRGALELQARAAALKKNLEDMAQRLQALEASAASAAPDTIASAPETAAPSRESPGPGGAGGIWRCFPYLLVVAAGIGYGLTDRNVAAAAPAAAPVSEAWRPAAVAWPAAAAPAPGEPANEALRLVYEYRLPGMDAAMLDLVGAREDALGPSPWGIECDESDRCEVTFISRAGGDEEPLYEFAVDLGAKAVTPSPSTVERLLSEAVAQHAA